MIYTKSQQDEIRAYIENVGHTVNENGCKVWNSTQMDRSPCYKMSMGSKTRYVNIRTFVWMDATGVSVNDTHTSCGTFTCINADHVLPGRKKTMPSKNPYVFMEGECVAFTNKIKKGIRISDHGCHIWGGTLIHGKIPCLRQSHTKNVCISRFLWTRNNDDFNPYSKRLGKTCGEGKCINVDHFQLVDKKKEFDRHHSWELLLRKATKRGDCLVLKSGPERYGSTGLAGTSMSSHRASYILNKNDGEPIPSEDEDGNRLVIRHLCHTPGCIAPDHLELGTQIVNSFEDKIASGTLMRGEQSPVSKITESVAQHIKDSFRGVGHPEYLTKKKRAEMFGTTLKTVASIDENRSWAHLPNRFGVVKSNDELRCQARKSKRNARLMTWSDQDFADAAKMIAQNCKELQGEVGTFPPGPCRVWNLCTDCHGYGSACFKGRQTKSHRLSLEAKHKRFAAPGEVVQHLCANILCCNTEHLCFGTRGVRKKPKT